jgi:hypothetical protein
MKRTDLVRELEKIGCVFIRRGANHDWYQTRGRRYLSLLVTGRSTTI